MPDLGQSQVAGTCRFAPFSFLSVVPALLIGCASPGSPRPPSLQLPTPVRDLSAAREGDLVTLRFTVPARTTDNQVFRTPFLTGILCRQVGSSPCASVDVHPDRLPLSPTGQASQATIVSWQDHLPAGLLTGPPQVLRYTVEVRNAAGRSAGVSDPAFAASGTAPVEVTNLSAQGTRRGILLRWSPVANGGDVLLERTQLTGTPVPASGSPATPSQAPAAKLQGSATSDRPARNRAGDVTWLEAEPGNLSSSQTLDGNVPEDASMLYRASRKTTIRLGGRSLELRSAPSAPVTITWRNIYPPATPIGLTALGYRVQPSASAGSTAPSYAYDLIWQPVEDPRLAGYLVYRSVWNPLTSSFGDRQSLAPSPIHSPGYTDRTAQVAKRYRYEVISTDERGNRSLPVIVEPAPIEP